MDIVLEKIHYNPECFSKILADFEDYVKCAEPGVFQKAFDDTEKEATSELIFSKRTTENMERALAELKNDPERFFNDFEEIKELLEGEDLEEKVDEWLNELPSHLYIFHNTVIDILWRANLQRYTTALRDTGKASVQ